MSPPMKKRRWQSATDASNIPARWMDFRSHSLAVTPPRTCGKTAGYAGRTPRKWRQLLRPHHRSRSPPLTIRLTATGPSRSWRSHTSTWMWTRYARSAMALSIGQSLSICALYARTTSTQIVLTSTFGRSIKSPLRYGTETRGEGICSATGRRTRGEALHWLRARRGRTRGRQPRSPRTAESVQSDVQHSKSCFNQRW